MKQKTNVLITGGTGTLGKALVKTAVSAGFDWNITVFSRDFLKQAAMKKQFPMVRFVVGDICDYESIYGAMVGHDIVIHAAAQKHIPVAEQYPLEAVRVNVNGSQNVAIAAVMAGVSKVLAISTDKVCYPSSIYGHTKAIMEKMWVNYANDYGSVTDFHLCRYGNVIGSAGSVLQVWERQAAEGGPITITDPTMTRFWLSTAQAVDIVITSLNIEPGTILVPKAPAMSMGDLAMAFYPEFEHVVIGRRPGEKQDEQMLTDYEVGRCIDLDNDYWILTQEEQANPPDKANSNELAIGYWSDRPFHELTNHEVRGLTGE